jgi:hypothetical protein
MKNRKIMLAVATVVVVMFVIACIDVPNEDRIINECQTFVEQAEEGIWARCSEEMDDFLLELQKWFEERIGKVKEETLTELGCVPADGFYGWDCTDSPICHDY